ncbi:hypothetical protein DFH94DRAFT_31282 [Russula ochroleuca]|jgi:hypothetical protein|uniref:Uncharacterized protein n=1 Tax=Russula ochroleuca TaxID=152965 RepID=A0A9P5MU90_9AGAM|nr:hypothetical protein DFH94DRAFT_31282 [Russula ochroleuca]
MVHSIWVRQSGCDDKLAVSLFSPSGSVSNPALSSRPFGISRSPVPVSGLLLHLSNGFALHIVPDPNRISISQVSCRPRIVSNEYPSARRGPPRHGATHALPCRSSTGFDNRVNNQFFSTLPMRKYETYTFSASKFFADRGAEGVAQPLTERVNVSTLTTRPRR